METGRALEPPAPADLPPLAPLERGERLPDRYRIREDTGTLTCVEAPTVAVRIERGRTVSAAAARGADPGSIFLDGTAQGPPFLDPKRGVYNLDHHEDCVRSFTLATCEQALVLVRKIVDLRKRDWTVHANDADLDTILAIWILLNHLRLNDDPRLRQRILPLIRLEGAIDVHGLGHLDLLMLPDEALRVARSWMDRLLEKESELAKGNGGGAPDLTAYVADRLREIDALVYPPAQIEDLAEIDEFARIPLGDGSVAIACRSEVGIYEVEDQLRRYHGDRLGMIVLQKDPARYTLRQLDPTLPADLEDVYLRLNLLDPASGGVCSENRWGGSEEIGGSPRSTGTRLPAPRIADAIAHVFRPPSRRARLLRVARAAALGIGGASAGFAAIGLVFLLDLAGVPAAGVLPPEPVLCFGATLVVLGVVGLVLAGRRAPGLYGLRRPHGRAWWALLPVAVAAALAGGAWTPALAYDTWGRVPAGLAVAAWLALPAAAELWFRGLVQGALGWTFPVQRPGESWRPSLPVLAASALYAPWGLLPFFAAPSPGEWGLPTHALVPVAAAFAFGLAAGIARERSESMAAPLLFHWIAAAAVLAVPFL